jgi:hypothetical protein
MDNGHTEEPFPIEDGEVIEGEVIEGAIVPMLEQRTKEAIRSAQERVLERIEAQKQLKLAALTFTTAEDWVFHRAEGGDAIVPYLEDSGSEKLMHAFAIEIVKDGEQVIRYPEDETFEVVIEGRVRASVFSDIWYPETGSRWSGDGFFSRGGKVRIDPGDVRKAATTNFYNRCIKKILGLRGLTVADLEKIATIDTGKVRTVTYQETSKAGPAMTEIMKERHVAIFVPYEDTTNRERVKGVQGAKFHREEHPVVGAKNVWILPWSKENESMAADLGADNAKIRWQVVDPNAEGGTNAQADQG